MIYTFSVLKSGYKYLNVDMYVYIHKNILKDSLLMPKSWQFSMVLSDIVFDIVIGKLECIDLSNFSICCLPWVMFIFKSLAMPSTQFTFEMKSLCVVNS